ncbi:response regulator transcription factor [Candidatus Dojkabacteria bacterium]|uniref:Response regulator transcription factor n=1 Tax=Candidatus Dojkabacteria bacterium TaxID=2099670 RepID=A0A847EU87_9BACT|nr:response regulator transcription factor [Candidatus Dojkabacteria bacterium]
MKEIKILVVDDEKLIVAVVQTYLEKAGYKVFPAFNGLDALTEFDRIAPDLVILDLMLPDLSGEKVCQKIRQKSRVPVIMLTAKAADDAIVEGFNYGADDYVTKPFSSKQLVARVQAVLRRTQAEPFPLSSQLSFSNGDLVIDSMRHEITKDGAIVNLTPHEFRILMTLARFPTKVFTREELISLALDDDYQGNDRVIDSHIKNLRLKIEDNSKNPRYVLTIHGIGYKFGGGL